MLVHLLDLVPDVGNMWQAFVQLQQTSNHALHYTAMLPDATSQEWFETTRKSLLVDQYLEGTFSVPGFAKQHGR